VPGSKRCSLFRKTTRLARAAPGLSTLLEGQVQDSFSHAKDLPGDHGLDQADGQGQPTVGRRADQRRIAHAGHPRLQAHHAEAHASCAHHTTTWTDLEDVPAHPCPADLVYWLLSSSVQKQALRDGERNPFPACKHRRVGVESDVVNSILMLGQRYFHVMEKLLVWLVCLSLKRLKAG